MSHHIVYGLMILASLLACLPATAADQPDSSIAQLSWLAGCWESTRGDRHIEEQWMMPGGGTMLGMSRTVTRDSTSGFEYMLIREQDGHLVFTAQPSGQEEASFMSIELGETKVVFQNKAHDFPQRIIYRRNGEGSVLARIEGERGGKLQGIDFPMNRSKCAEGVGR